MYEGLKEISDKIRALQSLQTNLETVKPLLVELQSPTMAAALTRTLKDLSAFNPKLLSPEEAQWFLELQTPSQMLVQLAQLYPFVQLFIPSEWFLLTAKVVEITAQHHDFLKAVATLEIVNEDSAHYHQFLIDYALEAIKEDPKRIGYGKSLRDLIPY